MKLEGLVVGVSRCMNLDSPVHFLCTEVSLFCNRSLIYERKKKIPDMETIINLPGG